MNALKKLYRGKRWEMLKRNRKNRHPAASKERLYMVFCEGGGMPTVAHSDFAVAAKEAARLAHFNRGERFHVLSSVRVCVKKPPAITQEKPFEEAA